MVIGNSWWKWWRWCPTSDETLAKAEGKMLEGVKTVLKSYNVSIPLGYKIRTIESESDSERLPIVMVHGFGAGIGMWALNLDSFASKQKIYAMDVIGFGRSSRPQFPTDPVAAENLFVQAIEEWRKEVGLETFILLGHSFGCYLSSCYTMKYPERVRHLILADPWGIAEKNEETEKSFQLPMWAKGVASVVLLFNPLASLRMIGPLGPPILRLVRPDLKRKFSKLYDKDDTRVIDYLYQVLVQEPSGESAFMSLTIPYGWARFPIITRLDKFPVDLPISILFGSRSWMHIQSGLKVKELRPESYVHFQIIPEASHHCYADEPEEFNSRIETILAKVDENLDTHEEQLKNPEILPDLTTMDNFGSFLKPV